MSRFGPAVKRVTSAKQLPRRKKTNTRNNAQKEELCRISLKHCCQGLLQWYSAKNNYNWRVFLVRGLARLCVCGGMSRYSYKNKNLRARVNHSSGAVWESRWTSWAVRPNEPSGLLVSVDVKNYWTVLRHWSQLVPNMSTDIWGH